MLNEKEEGELRNRKREVSNSGEQGHKDDNLQENDNSEEESLPPKYGPMPTFPNQRIWARMMLILGTLVIVYFTSNNATVIIMAKQKDVVEYRRQNTPCSQEYITELSNLPAGCKLEKCGLVVRDRVLTEKERQGMLDMVHDLYRRAETHILPLDTKLLTSQQSKLLKTVRRKIEEAVGPAEGHLRPAEPSHFTQVTNDLHYPYKERCKLCHFNALLYLNDFNKDFEGGRSVFLQQDNSTIIVEPRKGRVVGWNGGSGAGMESISSGVLHILRLSFTCT